MSKFFGFYLLFVLFRDPLAAFIIIVLIFFLIDQRYMRLFPRSLRRLQGWKKQRQLLRELALNPYNVTDKLEVGRLYATRKRYAQGIPYLEEALARMPEHAEGLYYLGLSYLYTGREAEGLTKVEAALALNPRVRYGEPYAKVAEYFAHKNAYERALKFLERCDEAGLVNTQLAYRKGQLLKKLGRRTEAKASFEQAVQYYATSPKYIKKEERRWALRARWAKLRM